MSAGKMWGLRRMSDRNGRFKMTAVDQRPPIKNYIREKLGCDEAPWQEVAEFKKLLIETLQNESSAMLLDPHYAYPAGISVCSPEKGLIITLEDSVFGESGSERLSSEIDNWSVEKIKRLGGDAVKVLIWYRPDASENVRIAQQDFAKRTGEACARFDIPFLLELLMYPLPHDSDKTKEYVEMRGKNTDHVLESVKTFAEPEFNVDVFKLESPMEAKLVPPLGSPDWNETQDLFQEMGRLAGRPWVMLSAGAAKEDFFNILTHAYEAGASGYLAGRAIWSDAFLHFPDMAKVRNGLENQSIQYMRRINELTDSKALPFQVHPAIGKMIGDFPQDETFRHSYRTFQND